MTHKAPGQKSCLKNTSTSTTSTGNNHWGVFHEIGVMKISDRCTRACLNTGGEVLYKVPKILNTCGVNFKYSCRSQACNFSSKLIIA